MSSIRVVSLAVPTAGPTVSATLDLAPQEVLVALQFSATYDGTAVAITGNTDGSTTLVPLKDAYNNTVSLTKTTNTAGVHYLAPELTYGLVKLAFTSGSAQGEAGGETIRAVVRTVS